MATSFAVTTTSGSVRLDSERRSSAAYTVTNRRCGDRRARMNFERLEGAQEQLFPVRCVDLPSFLPAYVDEALLHRFVNQEQEESAYVSYALQYSA